MTDKCLPAIITCYYDTRELDKKKPKDLAQRCCGETFILCEQLRTGVHSLVRASMRKNLEDAIRLSELFYEDALFRLYALRERLWDVLAALTDERREKTGNSGFRNRVLSKLKCTYPMVSTLCRELFDLADDDLRNRNVATHQTILFFGFSFTGDVHHTYPLDEVLMWHDPDSTEGRETYTVVRMALEHFVKTEEKRLLHIVGQAELVARLCADTIHEKQW